MINLLIEKLDLDGKLLGDYLRNLGLSAVVGSMTGFFLKPHTAHQLVMLELLLLIGITFSYLGIKKVKTQ